MGMENYIFWSKIGSGFGENQVAHFHQEFPGTPLKYLETNNSNTAKGLKTQTGRRQPAGYIQV